MQVVNNKKPRPLAKRFGIGADQVATYIKMGRQKVTGSAYDPYAKLKNPTQAMVRDAMHIASWYNYMLSRWTEQQRLNASAMVKDIQHGPQRWWRTVLEQELTPIQLKAAEFWALRYHAGEFVDVNLAPETRMAIATVLRKRMKGWVYDKHLMLDHLRFVFHGPKVIGSADALSL